MDEKNMIVSKTSVLAVVVVATATLNHIIGYFSSLSHIAY